MTTAVNSVRPTTVVFERNFRSENRTAVVMIFNRQAWAKYFDNGDIEYAQCDYIPLPDFTPRIDVAGLSRDMVDDLMNAYTRPAVTNLEGMLMAFESAGATIYRERMAQLKHDYLTARSNMIAAWQAQSLTTQAEGYTYEQAEAAMRLALEAEAAHQKAAAALDEALSGQRSTRDGMDLFLTLADEMEPDYSGGDDLHNAVELPY